MKTRPSFTSGVALIIVLGFLVLITALAVAFFTGVTTEVKASRNFQSEVTTRQLADSAVQIVMGQIATATTKTNEAWASQPGLIRVYGNAGPGNVGTASANIDAYYKLYSSDKMVLKNGVTNQALSGPNEIDPAWDRSPALWTDLNAPIMVYDANSAAMTPRFPIVDPRAYTDPSTTVATTKNPVYDVVYGSTWDKNAVEGFLYDTTSTVDGIIGPGGTSNSQRLPMPVKWIYVLADGTLASPSSSSGNTVFFNYGASDQRTPTAKNPIVGRIAFWTDDETCKLNINTAAGFVDGAAVLPQYYDATQYAGSFWDSPRFYTNFDHGIDDGSGMPKTGQASGGLALCQLLQYEFQRYPGHPATTSLGPVFKSWFNSEQIYALVPRYSNLDLNGQKNSTKGGTARVEVDNTQPGFTNSSSLAQKELMPKQDRLYASVDELLFGAHGVNSSTDPTYYRKDNISYVTAQQGTSPTTTSANWGTIVDRSRFFLTAQSRAPELNLYGQPRVSAWPVRYEGATGTSGMNVFDNLILFCSTVGTAVNPSGNGRQDTTLDETGGLYRYIFTRKEVNNAVDTTQGYVGSGSAPATPTQAVFTTTYLNTLVDSEQNRNKTLLRTYLPQFFGQTNLIPGFGTSWKTKYDQTDQQAILAEIFDYIRCANSQDTTTSLSSGTAIQFAPLGNILPSQPSVYTAQAKGLGRMSTICEASVVFYYAGPVMDPNYVPTSGTNLPPNVGWSRWDLSTTVDGDHRFCRYVKTDTQSVVPPATPNVRPHARQMRAFVVFSMFDPMQGYGPKKDPNVDANDPKMTIEAKWETDWTVNTTTSGSSGTTSLGFPTSFQQTTIYRAPGSYWGGRNFGGYEGFMHTLLGGGAVTSSHPYGFPHKLMWDANTPLNPAAPNLTSPSQGGDYGETWDPNAASGKQVIDNNFNVAGVPSSSQEYYPFQSAYNVNNIAVFPSDTTTFGFSGGYVDVNLYYGGKFLQSFKLYFPPATTWPVPLGDPGQYALNTNGGGTQTLTPQPVPPATGMKATSSDVTTWNATIGTANYGGVASGISNAYYGNSGSASTVGDTHRPAPGTQGSLGMSTYYWTGNAGFFQPGIFYRAASRHNFPAGATYGSGSPGKTFLTSLQAAWSFNTRLAWAELEDGQSNDPLVDSSGNQLEWSGDRWHAMVQPGDTIRSLLYWDANNVATGSALSGTPAYTAGGDLRVAALTGSGTTPALATPIAYTNFMPHPGYASRNNPSRACVLRGGDGNFYFPLGTSPAVHPESASLSDIAHEASLGNHIKLTPATNKIPTAVAFGNLPYCGGTTITAAVNGVARTDKNPGDWDTGLGAFPDGPFANKQDEGNVIFKYIDPVTHIPYFPIPYFTTTWSYQQPGDAFTSPSRQMPSAVMFGSLPRLAQKGHGWETLCFTPAPAGQSHPGNTDPKDHLLLDLFQMPVVEPYPISEPFSTAGKVNLNYRIVPFDYIRRSTALRGALYPLRVTAVQSNTGNPINYTCYKTGQSQTTNGVTTIIPVSQNFRNLLDREQTMAELDSYYDATGTTFGFKSASQICEMYLIPRGQTWAPNGASGMLTWWSTSGDLTGDNCREKPYADLYPRLTTKSNTYTVHMRVQTLRQLPRINAQTGLPDTSQGLYAQWNEGKDAMLGEYRGSAVIERYLDPADPRFTPSNPNFVNPDTTSLETMYHFRTVMTKKFSQ